MEPRRVLLFGIIITMIAVLLFIQGVGEAEGHTLSGHVYDIVGIPLENATINLGYTPENFTTSNERDSDRIVVIPSTCFESVTV